MERVYVNVGKADGFFAGNLIELLNRNSTGHRIDVGRIDLLPNYSLFDVRKGDAKRAVSALKGADFFGQRLYSEIADPQKDYARQGSAKDKEKSGRAKKSDRPKDFARKPKKYRGR